MGLIDELKPRAIRAIENNEDPASHNLSIAMAEIHDRQREVAARSAKCERGCSSDQLTTLPSGRTVCKWTRQRCQRPALAFLVAQYSILNA